MKKYEDELWYRILSTLIPFGTDKDTLYEMLKRKIDLSELSRWEVVLTELEKRDWIQKYKQDDKILYFSTKTFNVQSHIALLYKFLKVHYPKLATQVACKKIYDGWKIICDYFQISCFRGENATLGIRRLEKHLNVNIV